MATCRWSATLIPVGPQQPKWRAHWPSADFGHAGLSCHCPRTCGEGGDKHWFGTFHFDWWFGHAESVHKIHAEAANDGAKATPYGSLAGHAGLCKQRPQIPEHRGHWWWVEGLQVQPRNQGAVITVETFNIPEAIKGQASAEQRQSDVWLFSLTLMGWWIMSTHHKAKTLTKNTTWKSFVTFVILCSGRDQTCGQR